MGTIVENSVLLREMHLELRKRHANSSPSSPSTSSSSSQTHRGVEKFDVFENTRVLELNVPKDETSLFPAQLTLSPTDEKSPGHSGRISAR